jgi:hypothetical protein
VEQIYPISTRRKRGTEKAIPAKKLARIRAKISLNCIAFAFLAGMSHPFNRYLSESNII